MGAWTPTSRCKYMNLDLNLIPPISGKLEIKSVDSRGC